MRSYLRGGRSYVYWMTLPTPRRGDFARVYRAVNRAIKRRGGAGRARRARHRPRQGLHARRALPPVRALPRQDRQRPPRRRRPPVDGRRLDRRDAAHRSPARRPRAAAAEVARRSGQAVARTGDLRTMAVRRGPAPSARRCARVASRRTAALRAAASGWAAALARRGEPRPRRCWWVWSSSRRAAARTRAEVRAGAERARAVGAAPVTIARPLDGSRLRATLHARRVGCARARACRAPTRPAARCSSARAAGRCAATRAPRRAATGAGRSR